jgi:diguanylate cyclase (GGDEF)-like protein
VEAAKCTRTARAHGRGARAVTSGATVSVSGVESMDRPDGHGAADLLRARELGARRRLVLLAALMALALLPLALGATSAWPLLAVPVVLAWPLRGPAALALTAAVAALALALLSGRPGVSGGSLALGLAVFVVIAVVAGVRHGSLQDDLRRASLQSLTDRLTGLPNYAYLSEALPHEVRRADRYALDLSLVLMDLDGFKAFNDRNGHDCGNRMLAAVGATMAATARGSDIVGRFGGEEFAVIVPGPMDEAVEAAERLRLAVAAVRVPGPAGDEIGITISAGVAEHRPGEGAEALMRRADAALYAAKDAGRDRVVCVRNPVPRSAEVTRRVA